MSNTIDYKEFMLSMARAQFRPLGDILKDLQESIPGMEVVNYEEDKMIEGEET